MATITRAATEEDLLRTPRDGYKRELVDGQIRVSPAGYRHGLVCVRLAALLHAFAKERGLGEVVDSSTGFRLPGGNVRLPDVAFVAKGRFAEGQDLDRFAPLSPDLAIEVLSPDDRPRYVLDKVGEYLEAGVRLVWVIDPRRRAATVYRAMSDARNIGPDDCLEGEDVLPGFRCRLADLND
jgi:Uma2 family endonuclease